MQHTHSGASLEVLHIVLALLMNMGRVKEGLGSWHWAGVQMIFALFLALPQTCLRDLGRVTFSRCASVLRLHGQGSNARFVCLVYRERKLVGEVATSAHGVHAAPSTLGLQPGGAVLI